MRAKTFIILIVIVAAWFINFWNAHTIAKDIQTLANLDMSVAAEKNRNTLLMVENKDLRSGTNIASLVRVEMNDFVQEKEQGKIIYVQEPADSVVKGNYCIVDLIASKAHAATVGELKD
jgi:hypothetical protein